MKRRRIIRTHYIPAEYRSSVATAVLVPDLPRIGRTIHIREYISKVYGASPAIVFAPPGPVASVTRTLRKAPSIRQRAAWARYAARMNDGDDKIRGYDDGEAWPQTRGIH